MKKIFSVLLIFTLLCGCNLTAFAETTTSAGSQSTDVYADFVAGTKSSTIFTVDIEWTAMDFIYYEENEPVWDPETHTYSDTEAYDKHWEGEGTITVTNHSNTSITAKSTYNALDGFEEVGLNFSNPFLHLESAEIGNEAKIGNVTVSPYGNLREMDEKTKIGSITVTLDELELSDDFDTLLDIVQGDLIFAIDDAFDYIEYDLNNNLAIEVADASSVSFGSTYYVSSEIEALEEKAHEVRNADYFFSTVDELKSLYISASNALYTSGKKIKG